MRGRQTVRDMVLSMLAIGGVVFVGYLFIPHSEGSGIKAVDYRSSAASAKRAAPYPLLAPQGLSEKWKPTSVEYDKDKKRPKAWHLGFLTPAGQYAAIEQSTEPQDKAVAFAVEGAQPAGTATIGGQEWQRYQGKSYRGLVVSSGTGTTVVTGTADWEELTEFAQSLK
ncbi:DUF4245 domain-containing protein [Kitasatospora sp. NPDC002040]|uniref:DUF4245 domain-containing protein n=1 Tax=Kitasatospora sp. NPDC002040 TaxID=3154661 RepID=UPI00332049C2